MINVLHGRHVGVVPVACRSSRLVPPPLGCGAAQCTCAAGAALACPWGRGLHPPPKKGTRYTLKDSIGLNPHPETLRDYRSKPTIIQLEPHISNENKFPLKEKTERWANPGSNWRPSDLQSDALPTELLALGYVMPFLKEI